jgi:hypothetical protein
MINDPGTAQGFTADETVQFIVVTILLGFSYWWFAFGWEKWERRKLLRKLKGKSFKIDVCEP